MPPSLSGLTYHGFKDYETDAAIQKTLRTEFGKDTTFITIAHRLKTVLDYDRILVLGNGDILEFDTPEALINKPGGVFREMCRASADWAALQKIARRSTSSGDRTP